MANMGYCRFQNTAQDLRDCYDNWDNLPDEEDEELSENDRRELRARESILKMAKDIVDEYGDELES